MKPNKSKKDQKTNNDSSLTNNDISRTNELKNTKEDSKNNYEYDDQGERKNIVNTSDSQNDLEMED